VTPASLADDAAEESWSAVQHNVTLTRSREELRGGTKMATVGIIITFVGFLLAMVSPGIASGTSARLVIVLLGIALSLIGILGVLNPAYQKNANWKK
jgi:hypothetical protein